MRKLMAGFMEEFAVLILAIHNMVVGKDSKAQLLLITEETYITFLAFESNLIKIRDKLL